MLYGCLPVWLWVLVGGIFIGAVHDFSTLFVSLRERGRSMAEIARATLGVLLLAARAITRFRLQQREEAAMPAGV